jgi:hypothetical protein
LSLLVLKQAARGAAQGHDDAEERSMLPRSPESYGFHGLTVVLVVFTPILVGLAVVAPRR